MKKLPIRKLPPLPKRKNYALGSAVSSAASGAAAGSVIPGIGTVVGAIGGFIAGLFGGGPQMPNITDPVTGQQITDASGRVVASQAQLQSYANMLQGGAGPQAQNSAIQLLGQVSNGQGPNPAAAMLQEATAQNVNNQAALAAGQRGASSNVGLLERQAAQVGASTEQAAVGQAASTESAQQLNAATGVGNIAAQQEQAAIGAGSAAGNIALGNQGQVLNAQGTYNTNITGGQGNVNTSNTQQFQATEPIIQGTIAGGLAGASAAGAVNNTPGVTTTNAQGQPLSQQISNYQIPFFKGGEAHPGPHKSHVANYLSFFKGGESEVKAMVSPGEIYLSPDHVEEVKHGADPLKLGHRIGGKAKVKGDSIKNDTIPATLEEGGVVLPRHIVSGRSSDRARLFVLKSLAKKRGS